MKAKKKKKGIVIKEIKSPNIDRHWLKEELDKKDIHPSRFAYDMDVSKQMGSDILSGKALFPKKKWTLLASYLGLEDWKAMKFVVPNGRR